MTKILHAIFISHIHATNCIYLFYLLPTHNHIRSWGANYKVRLCTVYSSFCYFFPHMFKFFPQNPFSHTSNKFRIHKETTGTTLVNYIQQQMHTVRYKSYISLGKLLRISAPRCHPQGVAYTKVYKHQRNNLCSEMHSIRIFQILKLKIININSGGGYIPSYS